MNRPPPPFRRLILVCTNRRADGRPACGDRGSELIQTKLKAAAAQRGLKGVVRVSKSGCLDQCDHGPTVCAMPHNDWRLGVTADDLPAIIRDWIEPESPEARPTQ